MSILTVLALNGILLYLTNLGIKYFNRQRSRDSKGRYQKEYWRIEL